MDHEPWDDVAERYGATGEGAAWKTVQDDYHWDRLDEAFEGASSLGAGTAAFGIFTFRMIEAEHSTRQFSRRETINDWLELEWIEDDVSLSAKELERQVLSSADAVCDQFGWSHGPKTLVTILARSANAPWAPGRHGFCVDKFPYDKICLPGDLTDRREQLDDAMRHEYAHVMTLNRSGGQVPIWLDEAIAMKTDGGIGGEAMQMFAQGRWPWLSEHDLANAFRADRENSHGQNLVWRAYQQSAAIGSFLGSLKDDHALGNLMDAFSNNSVVADFVMRLRGREPVDEALHEIYGFGTRELWTRTRDWIDKTSAS